MAIHEADLPGSLGNLDMARDREEPHTVPSASICTNHFDAQRSQAELLSHFHGEFLSRRWRSISPNPPWAGLHRLWCYLDNPVSEVPHLLLDLLCPPWCLLATLSFHSN